VDKAFDKADEDGSAIPPTSGPHCAAGEIQYGRNETGILLYVKASLSGDEDDYILDSFPHETKGEQFFGEEQLGGLVTGKTPFAVEPRRNETEGEARLRILMAVREALLGTEVESPDTRDEINHEERIPQSL
jgi:hypothetical protein